VYTVVFYVEVFRRMAQPRVGEDGTINLYKIIWAASQCGDDAAVARVNACITLGAQINPVNTVYPGNPDRGPTTPLMLASKAGHFNMVDCLIGHGAACGEKDIQNEFTALVYAVMNSHPAVVDQLIGHGADVNAFDKRGYSVLMCACEVRPSERLAAVKAFLLSNRANVGHQSRAGATALSLAVRRDDIVEVDTLLKEEGVRDICDVCHHFGRISGTYSCAYTPLMYAVRSKNVDMIRLLLRAGADRDARGFVLDDQGRIDCTALEFAQHISSTPEVIAALRQPSLLEAKSVVATAIAAAAVAVAAAKAKVEPTAAKPAAEVGAKSVLPLPTVVPHGAKQALEIELPR
jgi:ankyrin repeat protein